MKRAQSAQRAGYRPDIDGLRAIAVLSVALYHAKIPGFSGGFVGVDIFFVISGFLITRIVVEETKQNDFSYWSFYERRARRILPALLVVAAAVAAFTLLYKSPRDTAIFGESLTLFSVFAANVFFYDQLDYFGDAAEFYPLLHTWSLAVEEQFYLFWPPLLLTLWAALAGRVTVALAVIAALSFVASVIAVRYDPQLAFFHTPFRMWQLMAGGLLAVAPPLPLAPRAREAAAAVGLALLLAPIPFYDAETLFPGPAALPPTLGAALVIASGLGLKDEITPPLINRLLSFGPIVFIGLCSYSFYLWHWPALSAARYLSFEPLSTFESLAILAAAFGISVLSLAYIERPFRRPDGVLSRPGVFRAAAASVAGLLLLGWALQESDGWPGRFPQLAPMFAEDARRYGMTKQSCAPALEALPADLRNRVDPRFCRAHDAGPGAPVAVLWGDSHLWALAPALATWAASEGVTAYLAWSPTCAPLLGYDRPTPTRFHDCAAHNRVTPEIIAALRAERVVLAAQWSRYEGRLAFEPALDETAAAIRAAGAKPIALSEIPPLRGHPPTILFRAAVSGTPAPIPSDLATLASRTATSSAEIAAAAAAARTPLIDVAAVFCPNGRCPITAEDGAPLYADSHHVNRRGARALSPALSSALSAAAP